MRKFSEMFDESLRGTFVKKLTIGKFLELAFKDGL